MGFFSSLFGKKEETERQLSHPSHLQVGDMITLDDSFALPPELKGQQLRVDSVNTYEYKNSQEYEWVLTGQRGETIFLGLDEDDETYLAFSIKITREQVGMLFDLERFAEIFEESINATLTTKQLKGELSELARWLGTQYYRDSFAEVGYFHKKDYRGQKPPQYEGDQIGETFQEYVLMSNDDEKSVNIEVYESGETDVLLTLYRPLSDIREYWPAT